MVARPLGPDDLDALRRHGQADFATVVKDVKAHLKAPLADKQPIYALNFKRLGRVGDATVAEDAHGVAAVAAQEGGIPTPPVLPDRGVGGNQPEAKQ